METRWGKRLGRYEIVAEIGRGAMGVVYKARDPKIDRFVALKTISLRGQDQDDEKEYRERFFLEAQAAGRLLHPGIVTVFDVGEEPQTHAPFIVMEFITGQSLKEMLAGENKTLPLDTALRLTEQVAEALDYAHGQGVVHRDIKPANILVTEDGSAKITDFGIAKLSLAHLTVPGHVLGTPAYMAPEQLEGEEVDGRSDLFSLGVILYSMLTGYRPFQGNSATTVCFKVVNRDPVPASALVSDLPPDVDAIVSRAMAKEPAQRYQRGIEFALDVRELRERLAAHGTGTERVSSTGSQLRSSPQLPNLQTSADQHWMLRLSRVLVGRDSIYVFLRSCDPRTLALLASCLVLVFSIGVAALRNARSQPRAEAPQNPALTVKNLPAAHSLVTPAPQQVNAAPPTKAESHASQTAPAPQARAVARRTTPNLRAAPITAAPDKSADPGTTGRSLLYLEVLHHFGDAELLIWIDGKLVYNTALHAESQRRMVLFHSTKGVDSKQIWVPSGSHSVKVRVQSAADSFDESRTVAGVFKEDDEKTLRIAFEKGHKSMTVSLE